MDELDQTISWLFLDEEHGQVGIPVGSTFGVSNQRAAEIAHALNDGLACHADVDPKSGDIRLTFHCDALTVRNEAQRYFVVAMRLAASMSTEWDVRTMLSTAPAGVRLN